MDVEPDAATMFAQSVKEFQARVRAVDPHASLGRSGRRAEGVTGAGDFA